MRTNATALAAGLIALLCLGTAAAALLVLFQIRAAPLPFLRSYVLERSARSDACRPPAQLVPGSYQADPVSTVGDFLVVTYTAECDPPGQPRQTVDGYEAMGSGGEACGGAGTSPLAPAPSGGPVTIEHFGWGGCGNARSGVSIVTGWVTGAGATAVEVQFANAAIVGGPIHNGRFAVSLAELSGACLVRALDASGTVLVEERHATPPGAAQALGTCP